MDARILTRIRHENLNTLPEFQNTTQVRSTRNFRTVFDAFIAELKEECFLVGQDLNLKDCHVERIRDFLVSVNGENLNLCGNCVTASGGDCVVRRIETVVVLQASYSRGVVL